MCVERLLIVSAFKMHKTYTCSYNRVVAVKEANRSREGRMNPSWIPLILKWFGMVLTSLALRPLMGRVGVGLRPGLQIRSCLHL